MSFDEQPDPLSDALEHIEKLNAKLADAKTRMEAAERCSGDWMRDRNIAIQQRDKAEAKLISLTGGKHVFIHAGDHCPAEARAEALYDEVNAYMNPTANRMSSREGLRQALNNYRVAK